MSEEWSVESPTTLDLGSDSEPVTQIEVSLVSGRTAVVAHPDGPDAADGSAQVEISQITGGPVSVSYDHGRLKIVHRPKENGLLGRLSGSAWKEVSAVVSITAPRSARISQSTVTAEVLAAGLDAPVSAKTVSGELVLDSIRGKVDANTVSGPVEVRELRGGLNVNTVSGEVTVSARDLPELSAKTVSGDVLVDLADADAGAQFSSQQKAQTVSGSITIRLPAGAGYRMTGKTMSGELVAGGEKLPAGLGQSKGSLRFGSEAVRVSASTMSGDVTVLHAAAPAAGHDLVESDSL